MFVTDAVTEVHSKGQKIIQSARSNYRDPTLTAVDENHGRPGSHSEVCRTDDDENRVRVATAVKGDGVPEGKVRRTRVNTRSKGCAIEGRRDGRADGGTTRDEVRINENKVRLRGGCK